MKTLLVNNKKKPFPEWVIRKVFPAYNELQSRYLHRQVMDLTMPRPSAAPALKAPEKTAQDSSPMCCMLLHPSLY